MRKIKGEGEKEEREGEGEEGKNGEKMMKHGESGKIFFSRPDDRAKFGKVDAASDDVQICGRKTERTIHFSIRKQEKQK